MLNLGPFKSFLLISYIGNNENLPITDEVCWSLDIRYCGASLYIVIQLHYYHVDFNVEKFAFTQFCHKDASLVPEKFMLTKFVRSSDSEF